MRNLFIAFFVSLGISMSAQNTSFFKAINNDSADLVVDAFQRDNGDYFILSNTNSAGDFNFQISKTNGLGNTVWSYSYGTIGDDLGMAMVSTSDDGMVVCGYTDGFSASEDAFVSKISSSGTLLWSRVVRTDSVEHFLDVTESINGDIYATGFVDQDTMGYNILVSRLTNTGSFLWANHYGGVGEDIGNSIIEDRQGRVVIAGSTKNDSVTIGSSGDKDIALLSLNSGGSVLRHKNIGTINSEFATSLVQESLSEYAIAGNIDRGLDGTFDGFIVTVDTNLVSSSPFYFGVPGEDNVEDLVSLGNNKWMVATKSASSFGATTALLFEADLISGVPPAVAVGGLLDNTEGSAAIAGRVSSGFSLISNGLSFGGTNSQDMHITKFNSQGAVPCVNNIEVLNFGFASFNSDTFTQNINAVLINNPLSLTRTAVVNSDTSFCCELEAIVSADTITICDGDVASLGRSSISGYQYAWTATGYSSTNSNPSVSPLISTEYKLVVSSADGLCTEDSALVYVQVNPRLSLDPLRDTSFCEGSSITLTGPSSMVFYEWDGTSGRSNGISRTLSVADTLSLRLIDVNGCFYNDTVEVLMTDLPVFSLGNDTTVCENLGITLTGPPNMEEYTWNGMASSSSTFTTQTSQVHTLLVKDTFGCEYQDGIQILTNPNSPFDLGPDSTVCEGESVVFFGSSVLTSYTWNGTVTNNFEFTAMEAGTYTAEAYNSFNCPSYDTVELFTTPLPAFSLGNDTGACDAILLQLRGPSGMQTYTWFNGSGNQTFNVSGAGLYYLEVENTEGCIYTDSIQISVYTSPTISLGNDTSLRTTDPLTLSPGLGFDRYEWSTGESSPSIQVADKGKYSVTVTDSNGCQGFDEMEILSAASAVSLEGVEFKVYPNPASSTIYLSSKTNDLKGTVQLLDNQGRVVLQKELIKSALIDVRDIPSGLYRLVLSTENSSASFNVVITR